MILCSWARIKNLSYKSVLWIIVLLLSWLIVACSTDKATNNKGDSNGVVIPTLISALTLPGDTTSFTASLYLDSNTSPIASVEIARDGSQATVDFSNLSVPIGTHILSIKFALVTNTLGTLVLATAEHAPIDVSTGSSHTLSFDINDYVYPDDDGVGASNLSEVNNGTDPTDPNSTPFDFWVDMANGLDTNSGTESEPFKTITYALSQAGQNMTIKVLPGTYNATNGETFPLMLQPGQVLIGDETNKGEAATPTNIIGNAAFAVGTFSYATVVGAEGSRISGFSLGEGPNSHFAVIVDGVTMEISNNSFRSSTYGGVYVYNSGTTTITGNTFNTGSYGVYIHNAPDGAAINNNTFVTPSLPIDVVGTTTVANITNNTITGSGQVGIQVQHGTPVISNNTFNQTTGYTYGAIRAQFASATPIVRGNTFICDYAIGIVDGNPDLGTATDAGNNDFSAVTGISVRHGGAATVYAIGNTWPATPPLQNVDIVVDGSGTVVWGTGPSDFYASLPAGLAAFYPFSGNALDMSGNLNDGIVNGATLAADIDGVLDSAYRVFRTGGPGDIEVSHSSSLDVQDFTLITWFNMDAVTDAFSCLIGKDYTTGYAIGISSGGSGVCPAPAGVQRGMRVYVGNQAYNFSLSDFACNTWYHVAVTHNNATGDVQLYVNGTLTDSGTIPSVSMISNTSILGIGKDGTYGDHFNGVMDQVHIYNRVLTGGEINAIFSQ